MTGFMLPLYTNIHWNKNQFVLYTVYQNKPYLGQFTKFTKSSSIIIDL